MTAPVTWMHRALRAVAVCCALGLAAPAGAQTVDDRAAARVAAVEGAKAFREGRFQEAMDLFERAEGLVHAPPHLLYIARAAVELGQLVKAREAYLKVTKETLPANAPAAFVSAQENAQTELPALEPRIPKVKVVLKGVDKGEEVRVTVDEVPLPPFLIGLPAPLDPGTHKFAAIAEGKSAPVQEQTVAEGSTSEVVLELNADPKATLKEPEDEKPVEAAEQASTQEAASPADEGPEDTGGGTNGLRIGSYVALGVGVVGLGLGTVFGLQSASDRSQVDDLCPGGACDGSVNPTTVNELNDSAGSAQTLALVSFIVGGVGVATGATLFVLSMGGGEEGSAAVEVRPWIGAASAGVTGKF